MQGMIITINMAVRAFLIPFYRNFPPSRFSGEKRLQASGRIEEHVAFQSYGHALRSLLGLELFGSVFEFPLGNRAGTLTIWHDDAFVSFASRWSGRDWVRAHFCPASIDRSDRDCFLENGPRCAHSVDACEAAE